MLVEDDKSLREIYGVRLIAEGYDIVSAGDGEEALAMAIKERPQLILSDVMMPKISGFDMLDILRSTTETRNIKVIMMTALSSEEQRARGEQLGADRYLVKSQVGIEDVIRVVHEVLGDTNPADAQAAPAIPIVQQQPPVQTPVPPAQAQQPSAMPPAPVTPPMPLPTPPVAPLAHTSTAPQPPSLRNRVIQPLNDPSVATVDMNDLLDKELAKEAGVDFDNRPAVASTSQEQALINDQLSQFATTLGTTTQPAPLDDIPAVSVNSDGSLTNVPEPVAPTPVQPLQSQAPAPPAAQTTPMPTVQAPPPAQPQPLAPSPAPRPVSMPTPISVPPRPADPVVPPVPSAPPQSQPPTAPMPPQYQPPAA